MCVFFFFLFANGGWEWGRGSKAKVTRRAVHNGTINLAAAAPCTDASAEVRAGTCGAPALILRPGCAQFKKKERGWELTLHVTLQQSLVCNNTDHGGFFMVI